MMNNGTHPGETRRHNAYRVDLTGSPADLDAATAALNAHPNLVGALRGLVAFVHDLDRTHCGLADFADRFPDLTRSYPLATAVLEGLGIDPFEED
jgi:hypothetical protein